MNLNRETESVKAELQIAPLIDVVFLLLIYFMVTASLVKKEGDISFVLPAMVEKPEKMELPVEALIAIETDGAVEVEGMRFSQDDEQLQGLAGHMRGLKAMALSQGSLLVVTVVPAKKTIHRRIIDVMDACAAAGVDNLSFGKQM